MNELDSLIREKIVPLRKRAVDSFTGRHPHVFSVLNSYLSKKNNHVGLQVTENGAVIGKYTFYLDGLYISRVDSDTLSSEINHPFGVIRPYGIIEKRVLEKLLEDEERLIEQPFSTISKYLPEITVKFMH